MRTLRLLLVGLVILALLGGLSVAVVAQGEADPMAPAVFTFTLEPATESTDDEGEGESGWTREVRGYEEVDVVEAGDQRASGLLTTITNIDTVEVDDGGFMTAATSVRLVNDGGAWSGTGRGVTAFVEDGDFATLQSVLTGEGGYEGLTLITNRYYDDDAQTSWGVIVPLDNVPPVPDPIEPTE